MYYVLIFPICMFINHIYMVILNLYHMESIFISKMSIGKNNIMFLAYHEPM